MKSQKLILAPFFAMLAFLWSCDLVTITPSDLIDFDRIETFLTDSLGMSSCAIGDTADYSVLPPAAQDYLMTHHAQDSVGMVVTYSNSLDTLYETELFTPDEAGYLYFDVNGDIARVEEGASDEQRAIADSVLNGLMFQILGIDGDDVDLVWSYNSFALYEFKLSEDKEMLLWQNDGESCYQFAATE